MTTSINEITNKILTGELTVDEAVTEYATALNNEVIKCQEAKRKEEEEKACIAERKAMEDNRRTELSDIINHTIDFLQRYFPDYIPAAFKLTKEETAEMADEIIAEVETEVARMKPYKQFFDLLEKNTSKDKEPKAVKTTMGDIPVGKKEHTVFTDTKDKDLFDDLMNKLFGAN